MYLTRREMEVRYLRSDSGVSATSGIMSLCWRTGLNVLLALPCPSSWGTRPIFSVWSPILSVPRLHEPVFPICHLKLTVGAPATAA